ncbi:MAG: COR domain-containing protein, partial [Cyanobacteria bacterium J06631_12]
EDENRIEYWLKLIQTFGGNSPVIIVGNKSDEQPLDINRKALRDKYPNIKAIIETSCQDGHGITDLRERIIYEVSQLSDVYNLLPLTWFNVKKQLETLDEDFITYARYACLCHEQNVTEEQSQEQLIDLLHNLGLVLNFREHPILKDTNVLKPDWVTTGIYALLSDEVLKTKTKGILTKKDLTRILNPDRYPSARHSYLIDLMEEFQLGFPLADTQPKKFLIPGLLPKDEPENTDLEGDTLEFQYHYRILPESIISRFIVLMHEDIHESIYWRSGVMLHYSEGDEIYNIARIRADPEDKKIFIAISGKDATRRAFLTLIRKTFHRIHSSFANPDITEWVPVPNYPDHPPLDYQELLGLERMGEQNYPIGKLGIRVNIRQLLDGYEPLEARLQYRRDEMGKEGRFAEEMMGRDIHLHFNPTVNQSQKIAQTQGDNQPMSTTVNQYGQGDNIAGDKVLGDKINTQINNNPDLAQAARDIKALLTELSDTYNPNSPAGQTQIKEGTLARIRQNPQLKQRTLKALKSAGEEALEQAIQHPIAKVVVEGIKSFVEN